MQLTPAQQLLQGEEQEAQALFDQVAELRAPDLEQQAAELARHAAHQAVQASIQNSSTSSANTSNCTAPSQPSASSAAPTAAPAGPSTPHATSAAADDASDDDWESSFETGKIDQQLESHLIASASKQQEASSDHDDEEASSSRKSFKGRGETLWRRPAREGFEHVVEVYGLSKQHKTTHLEDFLLQHQVC
jgi:hypothetical protein